jgi:hypothetical protein
MKATLFIKTGLTSNDQCAQSRPGGSQAGDWPFYAASRHKSTDPGPRQLDGDHSASLIPVTLPHYRFAEVRQLDRVKALM